ncbi:MAG: alpha/beta fold hydrolase [Candidatus Korobacteraceae bacterium]
MPFTNSNGCRIYWEESGAGDPLLLIMGLGYSHEMWHRTLPAMAEHYRTIVYDNRGVGKSDVPAGPYPMAQMADDAAAVLDAAGVERAHVYGISMGGMIAQELTLNHPRRVRSLILGCTACGGANAVPAAAPVMQILMDRATMTPEEGVQAMVPFIYSTSTPRARIDEDLAIRRRTFPQAAGYLAQIQGVVAWSSFDRLPHIRVPTLVLHGDADQLAPPENGHILARKISGARLRLFERASHIYPTDEPEASNQEVLCFLANLK